MVAEVLQLVRHAATREVLRRRIRDGLQLPDAARDERRITQRARAHGEVEALRHQVDHAPRQGHLHANARMLANETPDDRRERPDPDVDRGGQANDTAQLGLCVGRRGRGLTDVTKRLRDALEVSRARVRQVNLTGRPVEQADPEVMLELRDAAADRRLGQTERARRGCEATVLDDANEGGDAVEVHGTALSRCRSRQERSSRNLLQL